MEMSCNELMKNSEEKHRAVVCEDFFMKLIARNELEVSNFFSFLAAMMLAYQPVRSLATLNISIQQGLSGARRVLPQITEELSPRPNAEAGSMRRRKH